MRNKHGLEFELRRSRTPERKSRRGNQAAIAAAIACGATALWLGGKAPIDDMSGVAAVVLAGVALALVAWTKRCVDHEWIYPHEHGEGPFRRCEHCLKEEPWRKRTR